MPRSTIHVNNSRALIHTIPISMPHMLTNVNTRTPRDQTPTRWSCKPVKCQFLPAKMSACRKGPSLMSVQRILNALECFLSHWSVTIWTGLMPERSYSSHALKSLALLGSDQFRRVSVRAKPAQGTFLFSFLFCKPKHTKPKLPRPS